MRFFTRYYNTFFYRVRPAVVKAKTPALLKEDEYLYYML
jgi:hypothetical protein